MSDTSFSAESLSTTSQKTPPQVPLPESQVIPTPNIANGNDGMNVPVSEPAATVVISPNNRISGWFWLLFVLTVLVFGFLTFTLYGRLYSNNVIVPVTNQKNQISPTQKPIPSPTISSSELKPLSALDDVITIESDIANTQENSLNEGLGKLDGEVNGTN